MNQGQNNVLVNHAIIRSWLKWGFFWAIFAPFIGIILSLKFNFPDFLNSEYTVFGRLRPVHINGVIFGVFSTIFFGLAYYMVPKLTGIRLYKEEWGKPLVWLWNVTLSIGFFSLLIGFNKGIEAGELPMIVNIGMWITFVVITYQVFMTISRRKEEKIYVSLWYIIAAFIWTDVNLILGSFVIPVAIPGINNAALHGLYIHYVVGLWITPAGLSVIYFFLPSAARNALYSHKLSIVGFWSLAFFYPFVGIHHYLFSPIVDWAETIAIVTSMMLIIPVTAVLVNFFGTLKGKWHMFQSDFTVKLLIIGASFYFLGSTQGSFEALRSVQKPTHFTDFVIAHSHLTVFGGYIVFVLASCYYVWQRVTAGSINIRMAQWSTWMIIIGMAGMGFVLTLQGLIQGTMLMEGAFFVDTVAAMKPYWMLRTLAGTIMDIGIALIAINLVRSKQ